jgi:hypothetical protein
MDSKRAVVMPVLVVHSVLAFLLALLLLVTKWFPCGTTTIRLREWLYRVF